ncbi:MAG TPA: hypothetical protein DDX91_06400 [Ruminococcaceae bacterium]|nr:hypothetical protein [Oscillospiraceae bacterium]
MSKFSMFMKENKKVKENAKFAATNSLCDSEGKPLMWELRHISSKENEAIRDSCIVETAVAGKSGAVRSKLKTGLYVQKLIAASVAFPDLYDAELQDSYGAKTPEELLMALVDDPGEYNRLAEFVQHFQGFDLSLDEKVEQAKN